MKFTAILAAFIAGAIAAPSTSLQARDSIDARAKACCGVYICEGTAFDERCYWACYPDRERITVDPWWQKHAGSFGPDKGCNCYPENLTGGTCVLSHSGAFMTSYPGGDLGACTRNFKGFHCERYT